jgi:hypothetical protein
MLGRGEARANGLLLGAPTLPLIFTSSFVEDIFLAVDGENTVLERALPVLGCK